MRLGDSLDELVDDPGRLWSTLELADRDLIAALAGADARVSDLLKAWEGWYLNRDIAQRGACGDLLCATCRHHCLYPARLRDDPLAPHALLVLNRSTDRDWDEQLRQRKVVSFAGARTPSDYGLGIARAFAAELAAAGVIVAGSSAGVGTAARAAAVEAGGGALYIAAEGPGHDQGKGREQERECRVAETVGGADARRWPILAAERTLALVADLVLVIQAHEQSRFDLACADVARSRGVAVAVVPGPVDSPASCGSNHLLVSGARIVCSAGEALDALFRVNAA